MNAYFRVSELKNEQQVRETWKMRLMVEIEPFWDRLKVNPIERNAFLNRFEGLGDSSILGYEKELEKLKRLRREKMYEFIQAARENIRYLIPYSRPVPSEAFKIENLLNEKVDLEDYDGCEKLLQCHEQVVERLNMLHEKIQPIVNHCQKYLQLCAERNTYDNLIQDPQRLLNRSRTHYSLQEEEKLRRRVSEISVKVVPQLLKLIREFECSVLNGEKLVLEDVFGENIPVTETISKTEAEYKDRKEKMKDQRKKSSAKPRVPFSTKN